LVPLASSGVAKLRLSLQQVIRSVFIPFSVDISHDIMPGLRGWQS